MNRFIALTLVAVAVSFSIDPAAGADAPPGRYTASNGTVTDNKTGLVWSQTEQPGGPWAWVDAQNQCPAPWRVPTVQELRSIVDLTQTTAPTIDPSAFYGPTAGSAPNAGGFWTSSPYRLQASLGYAYYVDFDNGGIDGNIPTTPRGVRCVQ